MRPSGVTSKNRPAGPSVTSVLPLASRCAPEITAAKNDSGGSCCQDGASGPYPVSGSNA
jgi:hypothetical protein